MLSTTETTDVLVISPLCSNTCHPNDTCPDESLWIEPEKDLILQFPPKTWSRPSVKTTILFIFFISMIISITTLPVKQYLLQSTHWIADQGFMGYLVYIAIFWCSVLFGFPSTIFEALSGFVFGFGPSLVITTVGKTGGCVLVFGLGQILGKDTLGWYLKRTFPTFKALGRVIEDADWKLICLIQAAYLPIFIKCFLLSIFNVDFSLFLVTSGSCGIPYTLFWSYFGSSSHDILNSLDGSAQRGLSKSKYAFLSIGLIAGLGAMILLGRYTKKQMALLNASDDHSGEGQDTDTASPSALGTTVLSVNEILPEPNTEENNIHVS